MEQSDRILLERIRKGNHDAFRKWFELYYIRYLSFACTMISLNEAEDVVQNSFIKFWNLRETIDLSKSSHSLMLTIIRNEIVSLLRSPYFGRKEDAFYDRARSLASDIRSDFESKDRLEYYIALIDQLPPKRRQVFKMSRLGNMSNEDIAKKLGLSQRTVEKHIELALKQLRNSPQ